MVRSTGRTNLKIVNTSTEILCLHIHTTAHKHPGSKAVISPILRILLYEGLPEFQRRWAGRVLWSASWQANRPRNMRNWPLRSVWGSHIFTSLHSDWFVQKPTLSRYYDVYQSVKLLENCRREILFLRRRNSLGCESMRWIICKIVCSASHDWDKTNTGNCLAK